MIDTYGLKLVTAPAAEPVSLTEAKAHCRVDTSDDDTLIGSLITASREYVERILQRRLINSTWDFTLNRFESDYIRLPYAPLSSVTSVSYVDSDGTTQTLSTSVYDTDLTREPGGIFLKYAQVWPTPRDIQNAVTVRYVAGYGAAGTSVPNAIKQAMLLLIGNWYENRESVVIGTISGELPMAVKSLLWSYRVPEFY
jgi:uncharacterized phiE125 gp8 family phage protein